MNSRLFSKLTSLSACFRCRSGIKQEGLNYAFDTASGVLSISGRGERATWRGVTKALNIAPLDDNYLLKQIDFSRAKKIKRIGRYSFCRCMGLISADIPASVESISESAFLDCKNLIELRCHTHKPPKIEPDPFFYTQIYFCFVPKGTRKVYRRATGWSNYAKSWIFIEQPREATIHVSVPGTLGVSILKQSSIHSSEITHLTLSGLLHEDDFEFIRTKLTSLYSIDMSRLKNTSLPDAAFAKTKLARIKFPSFLTSIGERAFSGCRGLSGELLFPSTLTRIGSYAFKKCTGLIGPLTLPAPLMHIGAYAFAECSGLSGVLSLPPAMKLLGAYAFCGCARLEGELIIPPQLDTLEESVFSGCSGINSLSMQQVSSIGKEAFLGCSAISRISCLGNTLPQLVGESVFKGVSIENCIIHIPYSQSAINAYFSTPQWSLFKNYRESREI